MKYYDPDLYTRQAGRWEYLIAFGNFCLRQGLLCGSVKPACLPAYFNKNEKYLAPQKFLVYSDSRLRCVQALYYRRN